jgi:hypothetical protein
MPSMYGNKTPTGKISIWHESGSRYVRVNEEITVRLSPRRAAAQSESGSVTVFRDETVAASTGALAHRVGDPEA